MCRLFSLAALVILAGCSDPGRDPLMMSCETTQGSTKQNVSFYFEDGFLYFENDEGLAENACANTQTQDCTVTMTADALAFRQVLKDPYCGWRDTTETTLNVDRKTGAFRLIRQGCDPGTDRMAEGTCRFWTPE